MSALTGSVFLLANFILLSEWQKVEKRLVKMMRKRVLQTSDASKIQDVSTASGVNDAGVSQKLDTLLEAVKHMGEQLKQQDETLRRQEEKMSIHNLSAVPSAQRLPKAFET